MYLTQKIVALFKESSFKRLYKHSVNYGFGDVLAQIIGFLLIPLYTRYLTPGDYGIVEMTSTLTIFAIPIMKFGLPGAVSRYYFDFHDDPNKLKNFVTTMNRLLNYLAILSGTFMLLLLFFWGESILPGLSFWPFIVIAIITAGLGANNQLQYKLIQNREQSRYSVKLKTVFTFVSILLAIIFVVFFKMGALGLIISQFIITIAFFIQASWYLRPDLNGDFDKTMARDSLNYGMGVLPHHFAAAAAPMINKTLLVNMGTLSSLGLYSIALRFFLPLEMLYTATNTAFFPIYTGYRKNGEVSKIKQNIRQILVVGLVAYALAQLLGPYLMNWVLPLSYKAAIPLISILSIAFIGKLIYGICVAEIFYSKKTKFVSIVTISGLIFNIIVCISFVRGFGSYAISWAFSAGFLTSALLSYFYKKKVSDFDMYTKEIILFLIATTIVTLVAFRIYL